VSYAVVGLFERRAVNAGNPVSILFMVTCFFSLTQRDLVRVRRRMAETRGTDPSLDGAEQAYALQAAPEPGMLPVMEHRHRR